MIDGGEFKGEGRSQNEIQGSASLHARLSGLEEIF